MNESTSQSNNPALVVGVGASAGGLEAFRQFLSVLPNDTGMTFLLVQHLDPSHKSLLPELLAPCTGMTVRNADHGLTLERDTVYIIRPDTALAIHDGKIELSTPTLHRGVRLPVDHLFHSLSRNYGPRAAGIVLSGAASDGTAGIREIKAAGGLTIAQDPATCSQAGMPKSAIGAGVIDLVLQIQDMPAALARFASLPPADPEPNDSGDAGETRAERRLRLSEHETGQLAAMLEAQTGFDLRVYKQATIERRVLRRMTLSGFEDISAFFDYLRAHPAEQQTLIRDLLISVTDFFRDPEAFRTLREMVIDPLVAQSDAGDTLRVWVPGCATGEEAYSIAMEFLDTVNTHNQPVNVQIFATDIDQDAIAFARSGIYPESIAEQISEPRLQAYFKPMEGKGYGVRAPLRDAVTFAVHDLTRDPPFSRMDLVSCRNVLIYLTPEAQKHVLKVLHFALEPDGYLFLSTSESTGVQRELFSTLSKTHRVYRKLGASRPFKVTRSHNKPLLERQSGAPARNEAIPGRRPLTGGGDVARRAVLDALVPPTVVVAEDGSVLFTHGELGPYLRIPQGDSPRLDLGTMLRPEIATRARGVLYKCRRHTSPVTALAGTGNPGRIRISARPAPALGNQTVILTFEHLSEEGNTEPQERPELPGQENLIEQLEQELTATREDLRNTVEELEKSNEELRISNEESMSMNEELQSANEELEATSEELRSLNEELTTVNSQLREKIEQLEQAHDDLHNFFASTKIATVFLDDRLCIKRFTPAARELLGIDDIDTGRYIGDFARELLQNDLEQEAKTVLEHLSTSSHELHTTEERWIARQVLPYRTEHRRIEGVVVTFVDITDLKTATERLSLREHQQSVIARIGLHALRESNLQVFMDQVVREVQQTLNTDYCKLLEVQPGGKQLLLRAGVGWKPGLVGNTYVGAGPDSQSGYTLESSQPVIVDDLAKEKRFTPAPLFTEHGVISGLSCIIGDTENPYGVIGAHTRQRRHFTLEDINFLQAVASVLSSAITRQQTRKRLAVELVVAQVLAEATDLDETLPRLLENMTSALPASVGEIWWRNDGRFVRRYFHVAPAMDRDQVEQRFGRTSFETDDGLVGRVYKEVHAQWCSDLGDPNLFMRRNEAKTLGLVSGFGLPICAGSELLGVITFFSTGRLLGDDVFLSSLDGIGRTVGDFVRRMEADQRMRLSETRKAAVVNASLDGIVTIDNAGCVVEFNQAAQAMFGYAGEEAIGKEMASLIVPERFHQAHREGLAHLTAGGTPRLIGSRVEMPAVRKDGSELLVELAITRIGDGESRLFTGFIRDITERKRMENALLEADRQKDEFLAMLGHELRNPLAAIRTAAELLKFTDGNDPNLAKTQAIIERQSAHMAKLLDGILDVSRIIRGKIHIEPKVVDLSTVCRDVISDMTDPLRSRQLDIQTDIPPEPLWVDADPVRLAQIIDNLLTNAIKYTRDGGRITIALKRENGMVALKVKDTGVGIETELMPYIFEVFRQSKQSLDRSHGGLGLGLALVKTLTEMHGGRVEARSDGKDKGAEFIVRLPLAKNPAPKPQDDARKSPALKILLIEDNEDSAEMLRQVLELSGHEVMLATRAQQGIDLARQHRADIILCDIGLPDGMSGFDVAKALRGDPQTRNLRLVALTGYGRQEDKLRCADAGFDTHLTKPVDISGITRILEELRRDTAGNMHNPDASP